MVLLQLCGDVVMGEHLVLKLHTCCCQRQADGLSLGCRGGHARTRAGEDRASEVSSTLWLGRFREGRVHNLAAWFVGGMREWLAVGCTWLPPVLRHC